MKIHREDLEAAARAGELAPEQVAGLWAFLARRQVEVPSFRAAHILYYLGGLIAIGAVSLFITLAWETWAGWPMLLLGLSLALAGVGLAERFAAAGQRIPVGIAITFAVATVPLIVYSLQNIAGYWDGHYSFTDYHRYVDWRWLFMELGTLAAASVALWRYREPFTLMLVAVTLWYLSMDLAPLLGSTSGGWGSYYELRRLLTFWMGAGTLLLAFWVDVRSSRERDYAFWLYFAGVLMFWFGMTLSSSDSELAKFGYLLINLALIAAGAGLRRRVFAVFGGLGVAVYLGHLSTVFRDSLLFPVALAVIGLLVIQAGVLWQKYESVLQTRLLTAMPGPVRRLLERAQA